MRKANAIALLVLTFAITAATRPKMKAQPR